MEPTGSIFYFRRYSRRIFEVAPRAKAGALPGSGLSPKHLWCLTFHRQTTFFRIMGAGTGNLPKTREVTLHPWFRKPWPWLGKSVRDAWNPNIVAARDQRNGFSGGRRFIRIVDGTSGQNPKRCRPDKLARGFKGSKFQSILERQT